jgi:hypothetical protein
MPRASRRPLRIPDPKGLNRAKQITPDLESLIRQRIRQLDRARAPGPDVLGELRGLYWVLARAGAAF